MRSLVEETSDDTGSKVYIWLLPPMIDRALQHNAKYRHSLGPAQNADSGCSIVYIGVTDTRLVRSTSITLGSAVTNRPSVLA